MIRDELFRPGSVAIVGVSQSPSNYGNLYLRWLLQYGYRGKIYPVNPKVDEVFGIKAYPSLRDIPEDVDYVICCIPAPLVPSLIDECREKKVRLIHILTGRLSETGREEGRRLEEEILKKARSCGIRIIGPNGMGLYYPREGFSFNFDLPKEHGTVGGAFQSGGLSGEFVRLGALRGLRFSKVISYGNALDLDETDFLKFFGEDDETEVIALYVEGVKDGRRFLETLKNTAGKKPVVILKGGEGEVGSRSALSHTASLSGSPKIWEYAIKQAGGVKADSFEELIDLCVAFYFMPPVRGRKVAIAGGGGGKSVLSADVWEREGFELPPIPAELREALREKAPHLWDWINNPIDRSIIGKAPLSSAEILRMMDEIEPLDLLVINLTEDSPWDFEIWSGVIKAEIDEAIRLKERGRPVLVVMNTPGLSPQDMESRRWKFLSGERERLIKNGVPVFPSPGRAARAISKFISYKNRGGRI